MSSSRIIIREAGERDSAGLVELFRSTPQQGQIVINFERSPNFFWGAGVISEEPLTLLAEDSLNGKIVGSVSFGRKSVFINGKSQRLRYGNDLHLHEDYRTGRTLIKLYKEASKLFDSGEWCHTAILSDNERSINAISKGRASLPKYRFLNKVTSNLIYVGKGKRSLSKGYTVRRAVKADVAAMQAYFDLHGPRKQFFPVYDFSKIGCSDYYRGIDIEDYFLLFRNDELLGVVGVWDQQAFRQTRFLEYKGVFKILKPLYNAYSRLFGGLVLPAAGSTLNYQMLHSILIKDNNPEYFSIVIREIYTVLRELGCDAFVCGLSDGDPLKESLKGYRYRSNEVSHFVATYDDFDPRDRLDLTIPTYFEPGRW
ncbi:hypothetical protein A9Q99_27425 [Gammaproteobacteria bacterium 45_16_T64]|nr:hypothetical protein A9Q99_27425 [Gammaproteobacteria bacterium 45_16_T64]